MARPPSTHPTDAEMEVLKVLWDQGSVESWTWRTVR
jgi:hypothetical protein